LQTEIPNPKSQSSRKVQNPNFRACSIRNTWTDCQFQGASRWEGLASLARCRCFFLRDLVNAQAARSLEARPLQLGMGRPVPGDRLQDHGADNNRKEQNGACQQHGATPPPRNQRGDMADWLENAPHGLKVMNGGARAAFHKLKRAPGPEPQPVRAHEILPVLVIHGSRLTAHQTGRKPRLKEFRLSAE